jgi:hypothetical protein
MCQIKRPRDTRGEKCVELNVPVTHFGSGKLSRRDEGKKGQGTCPCVPLQIKQVK